MLNNLSLIAASFSVIALVLLVFQKRTESNAARVIASSFLIVLLLIQLLHGLYVNATLSLTHNIMPGYLLLLSLVGPLFYLYSLHIIQANRAWSVREGGHFLIPVGISLYGYLFPGYFNIAYSLTFLLGGLYMFWLGRSLFQMRARRTLFKMEFIFTSLFLVWALAVALLGVLSIQVVSLLIPVQTIMLAMAIVAALHIQLNYPHLLSSLEEILSRQYQASTLQNVDCDDIGQRLEGLMSKKRLYQDADLSLTSLAEMLSLKPYQLSEFINTRLNSSFSSYLREKRIRAAEKDLLAEPEVSVLAIGMSVGFSSQSAFYSAFKELHGMAPGQFRRLQLAK